MDRQDPNRIVVFEHDTLRTKADKRQMSSGEPHLSDEQLAALESYFERQGKAFFTLVRNGVQFSHFVGVLQVGKLTIEVLPKADKNERDLRWQSRLVGMLRAVHGFDIQQTGESHQGYHRNHILDLYFEIFLGELEQLLRRGLAKRYRPIEGNRTSLKGSLRFGQYIQQNLVHQERFFVRHTTYDAEHLLHQILWKTLLLLRRINTSAALQSRIGALSLNFPEMPDVAASEAVFDQLKRGLNRKTEHYRKALQIAEMLLLNYHPDVAHGRNHVLALMFNMNLLWEKFVFISLRKHLSGCDVQEKKSKDFWKPEGGRTMRMEPDIVLEKTTAGTVIWIKS